MVSLRGQIKLEPHPDWSPALEEHLSTGITVFSALYQLLKVPLQCKLFKTNARDKITIYKGKSNGVGAGKIFSFDQSPSHLIALYARFDFKIIALTCFFRGSKHSKGIQFSNLRQVLLTSHLIIRNALPPQAGQSQRVEPRYRSHIRIDCMNYQS